METYQSTLNEGRYTAWAINTLSAANWKHPDKLILNSVTPPKTFPVCDPDQFNHTWDDIDLVTGCPKWIQCVLPNKSLTFTLLEKSKWIYMTGQPLPQS